MQPESALLIAKGMIILTMIGPALAMGIFMAKAFEAMGRNPEAANSIFTKMIIAVALVESIAIYALVAFFIIKLN